MSKQIQIDFGAVEDFAALPEGSYPVTVDHVEMRDSKSSDVPYLSWDLIVSGEEYAGRHLFFTTSLSEKSLWRLKAVLNNLGVLEEQMSFEIDEESKYVTSPELSGIPALAIVTIELYQGRTQNRVEDLVSVQEAPAPAKKTAVVVNSKGPIAPAKKAPALKLK
jgi:hypothetical protein